MNKYIVIQSLNHCFLIIWDSSELKQCIRMYTYIYIHTVYIYIYMYMHISHQGIFYQLFCTTCLREIHLRNFYEYILPPMFRYSAWTLVCCNCCHGRNWNLTTILGTKSSTRASLLANNIRSRNSQDTCQPAVLTPDFLGRCFRGGGELWGFLWPSFLLATFFWRGSKMF